MSIIVTMSQNHNIARLIQAEGQKLKINAIIHRCSRELICPPSGNKFFNLLIIDQSGVLMIRVFPVDKRFAFLPTNVQIGNVYSMDVIVRTYVAKRNSDTSSDSSKDDQKGEKVGSLHRNEAPKLSNRNDEIVALLQWYTTSYQSFTASSPRLFELKNTKFDGVRISVKGKVIVKNEDSSFSGKTTYTIKLDQDNCVNIIIWKNMNVEFQETDVIILRHIKSDYWNRGIQYTFDDFSEFIILNKNPVNMPVNEEDSLSQESPTKEAIANSQMAKIPVSQELFSNKVAMSQSSQMSVTPESQELFSQKVAMSPLSMMSSPSKRLKFTEDVFQRASRDDHVTLHKIIEEIEKNENKEELMTSLLNAFVSHKKIRTTLNMEILIHYIQQCAEQESDHNQTYIIKELFKIILNMPRRCPHAICKMFQNVWSKQSQMLNLKVKSELLDMCVQANTPKGNENDSAIETGEEDVEDFLKDILDVSNNE